MVEGFVEFIDGARAERVAHFGPVKGDAHGAEVTDPAAVGVSFDVAVVRDVLEIKALNFTPQVRVEDIGNFFWNRIVTHMP